MDIISRKAFKRSRFQPAGACFVADDKLKRHNPENLLTVVETETDKVFTVTHADNFQRYSKLRFPFL